MANNYGNSIARDIKYISGDVLYILTCIVFGSYLIVRGLYGSPQALKIISFWRMNPLVYLFDFIFITIRCSYIRIHFNSNYLTIWLRVNLFLPIFHLGILPFWFLVPNLNEIYNVIFIRHVEYVLCLLYVMYSKHFSCRLDRMK